MSPGPEAGISIPSSVFLISGDGRILHLPIPSNSPRDPLNWSLRKRVIALGTVFLFSIIGLSQIQGASLLLTELQNQYTPEEIHPFRLELLAGFPSLFIGIGVLIWVPLSVAIGRRPVFLICAILLLLATVGAALSKSFYSHLAARCLQGLALSVSQGTVLLMIIDLTFIHQRAIAISLFWALGGIVSNILLTATPHIIAMSQSWRAFYYVWIPPSVLSICLAFFFCPETFFRRPPVAFDGRVLIQSSTEKVTIFSNWDELYDQKALPDLPSSEFRQLLRQLKFWGASTNGGLKSMRDTYAQILISILNPLVFWVVLLNAIVFGGLVSQDSTYTLLLSSPPYSLSINTIALTKLSAAAGSMLAFPAAGMMTSRISRCLTARNGGMRQAEHYLPSFIIPVISGTTGAVLYGVAGGYHLHYSIIFLSYGLLYLSFISLFTSNTLWATEAFPQWAAASLAVVGGGSYMLGFGLSFVMGPWMAKEGFTKANCEVAGLILGVGCIGIPMAFWGGQWRAYIAKKWATEANEGGALRPR